MPLGQPAHPAVPGQALDPVHRERDQLLLVPVYPEQHIVGMDDAAQQVAIREPAGDSGIEAPLT